MILDAIRGVCPFLPAFIFNPSSVYNFFSYPFYFSTITVTMSMNLALTTPIANPFALSAYLTENALLMCQQKQQTDTHF